MRSRIDRVISRYKDMSFRCFACAMVTGGATLVFGQDESQLVLPEPVAPPIEQIRQPSDEPTKFVEYVRERDFFGYPVSDLVYMYPFSHPDLPDLAVLDEVIVPLSQTSDGYVRPIAGSHINTVRLRDLGADGVDVIYTSALAVINQAIRDYLEAEYGLIGHLVTPDASEIAYQTTREDLRASASTTLTIMVWRAAVGDVRTVAHGNRLAESDQDPDAEPVSNVNRPEHRRIRKGLNVEPGALLTRNSIDDEVHRLNRFPGRRVDIAIAPSQNPGEVVVDYLVTEPKQWNAYAQTSNTGTESTAEWQQRFGVIHRQLTGRDDVFSLDYVTTEFESTHAVLSSYTFDFGPKTRLKLFGRWNEYTARDVGLGFENFKGDGFSLGAEAAINIWQDGPKFIDFLVGARVEHIHVENRLFLLEGEDDFLLPSVGVRYEKSTPIHSVFGQLTLESNWGSVVGSSKGDVQTLGRFGADDHFTVLKGQLTHSFFLEPIFNKAGFRGESGTDEMTLAHEVMLNFRGQYSFNSRLVPNYEFVAGGFHSVRGYPESSAVGDDGIMGSAEYRFHLGRSLPARADTGTLFGKPFRTARARPYGRADWDVIFKGFVDVAHLSVNDAPFFENNETLIGTGVGIETQLRSNLTLRLDYGMALTNIGEGISQTTSVGDTRIHFSAQFVF